MDRFEERLINLEKTVKRLEGIHYGYPEAPKPEAMGRLHPHFAEIQSRIKGVCAGLFSPWIDQLGFWCTHNYPDWDLLSLKNNLSGLSEIELDELAAILEVK